LLSKRTTVEQIDAWRAAKSETENLEFKEAKNQFDFGDLLSYCVAIANERGGILLLGVANRPPRSVVGTKAFLNTVKTAQDIFNKLHFRVDVEEVQHPDGRVLVFHIPSRPIGHPHELDGAYYMRSGESLVAMTPDQLKQIFEEKGAESYRKKTKRIIIALVAVLVLVGVGAAWFKYQALTHVPRQRDVALSPGPTETHQTLGNPTAVVKHPEQKPNTESYDTNNKSETKASSLPSKTLPTGKSQQPSLPPNSGKLTISQTSKTSTRADAPYETEIVIQTTESFPTLKMLVQCDKPLLDVQPSIGGTTGTVQMMVGFGILKEHPSVIAYSYGSSTPPFSPANPVVIDVWSKEPVTCKQVTTF
jgi:hypothetical protein